VATAGEAADWDRAPHQEPHGRVHPTAQVLRTQGLAQRHLGHVEHREPEPTDRRAERVQHQGPPPRQRHEDHERDRRQQYRPQRPGDPEQPGHRRRDEGADEPAGGGHSEHHAEHPRGKTEAGVSKDFLCRTPDLRDRVERLRSQQTPRAHNHVSSTDTGDGEISSVVRTLTLKLTQERAQHRREVAELRAALAAAHGELLLLKRRHGIAEP
jgi:hypothetical protein